MLYAVRIMQTVCKYAGVGEGNLFFFGGGKKREGKSSFAISGFVAGVADCKCAFPLRWALFFVLNITSRECIITSKEY